MPEPTDIWVGPRLVRWWDQPLHCNHSGRFCCPECAELTPDEAAAISEYITRLRADHRCPSVACRALTATGCTDRSHTANSTPLTSTMSSRVLVLPPKQGCPRTEMPR